MGEEAAHDAAAAPTPAAGDVGWGDAAADEQKSPGEPPGIFDGLDLSDEVKKRLLTATTSDTLHLEHQSLGPEGAGALVGMGHLFVAKQPASAPHMLDALCHLLYPVSAAHTSIFRMDSNFSSHPQSDEVKKRLLAASTSDTLNLEYQSLGPEGAGALAGALVGMGHLSTLELGFNKLGPGGVRALAGPLSMFMGITTLTLSGRE
ncbi:hypothetical protein T484DRAFT_1844529 [Baffinella frigidus]|nr:hypothetical protein T484DRAFT_1844529 [Cryptophyta sp. CCMP2293]